MLFAHIADCHIGGWRDPKMKDIQMNAFCKAVDMALERKVDFIIIAGDLFNTSLPNIDNLKDTTTKLKEVKDKNVPVYIIPGSHDFSPSGKTMLDVLENAGLVKNVCRGEVADNVLKLKFIVDPKTGAKLTGIIGLRGMLDKKYYEALDRASLEKESGKKIFLWHTSLTELLPKKFAQIESTPLSMFPKGFFYYAGGHIHDPKKIAVKDYGIVAQTGALFPNSFSELEEYGHGGFYVVEDENVEFVPVKLFERVKIEINCDGKNPQKVEEEILAQKNKITKNCLVTIRLEGTLESGKPSEIDFRKIFLEFENAGAYNILKNTAKLNSKEFEEIKISTSPVEDVEEKIIKEHLGQFSIGMVPDEEYTLIKQLMSVLYTERGEGEKVADYEARVKKEVLTILKIE
ncbi:MAG: exonuclease SbcCD subunit D [Candidatus Woesearchaeota archaeon]